jgi:hypothetical protein
VKTETRVVTVRKRLPGSTTGSTTTTVVRQGPTSGSAVNGWLGDDNDDHEDDHGED